MYRSDNGRTEVVLHNDIYTHYPSDNTAMHDQRLHFIWHEKLIRSAAGQEYRQEVVLAHVSNAWKYDRPSGYGPFPRGRVLHLFYRFLLRGVFILIH